LNFPARARPEGQLVATYLVQISSEQSRWMSLPPAPGMAASLLARPKD
jgi:hypothetical protein